MRFVPATEYDVGLLAGAALLVALVLFALVRGRRHRDETAIGPRRPLSTVVVTGLGLVVLILVAGPVALVLLPLVAIGLRWGPDVTAWIAGGAFLGGGIAAAWSPGAEPVGRLGAFSPAAQVCTAVALASVIASLAVAERTTRSRRGRTERGSDSANHSENPVPVSDVDEPRVLAERRL
jgi:arabinofuranan 3-O-arabinosyltransferase